MSEWIVIILVIVSAFILAFLIAFIQIKLEERQTDKLFKDYSNALFESINERNDICDFCGNIIQFCFVSMGNANLKFCDNKCADEYIEELTKLPQPPLDRSVEE